MRSVILVSSRSMDQPIDSSLDSQEQNDQWQRFLCEQNHPGGNRRYAISNSKIVDHGSFAHFRYPDGGRRRINQPSQHWLRISSASRKPPLEIGESTNGRPLLTTRICPDCRKVIARATVEVRERLLGSSSQAHSTLFKRRVRPKERLWIALVGSTDTIEAMNLLTGDEEPVIVLEHLDDFGQLDEIFEKHGERIAGITDFRPTFSSVIWKGSKSFASNRMLSS